MSDNRRRYRAIHQALKQCYSGKPKGNMAPALEHTGRVHQRHRGQ